MLWITEFCEEKHKKKYTIITLLGPKLRTKLKTFGIGKKQQRKTRENTRSKARALNQD